MLWISFFAAQNDVIQSGNNNNIRNTERKAYAAHTCIVWQSCALLNVNKTKKKSFYLRIVYHSNLDGWMDDDDEKGNYIIIGRIDGTRFSFSGILMKIYWCNMDFIPFEVNCTHRLNEKEKIFILPGALENLSRYTVVCAYETQLQWSTCVHFYESHCNAYGWNLVCVCFFCFYLPSCKLEFRREKREKRNLNESLRNEGIEKCYLQKF